MLYYELLHLNRSIGSSPETGRLRRWIFMSRRNTALIRIYAALSCLADSLDKSSFILTHKERRADTIARDVVPPVFAPFSRRDYETLRGQKSFINPRRRSHALYSGTELFFFVKINQSALRRRRNAEKETRNFVWSNT